MDLNKESRTINASQNIVSAFFNKICMLLLTFICRKFFIQYIGVEYLGINGLFSNILTLLSMAELGLGTAMNVSLYRPIAEGDTRKLSALLNFFKQIYYIIAISVFFIGIFLIPFLKYIINIDRDIPYLYVYYIVFVLKNTISYLFVYKASILKADQRTYLINKIEIYVQILISILKIVTIILLKNYLIYILLDVVAVIAHNIIVSYLANKNYSFLSKKEELSKEEKKRIFSDVSAIFIYKISNVLINGTDNILMSVIVGTVSVGLYSNYYTITSTIDGFITLLFSSLTAGIGNLIVTASSEYKYKTFKMIQMISFWICGFVCISLFILTQDFIQLWIGKEFLLDNLTLIAIVINVFFSTCMRPIWTFREGTGMYAQIRYIMVGTAIINLVLSIMLGNWLGISGILLATSISKVSTYFWYEPNILYKKFFDKNVREYYVGYIKNIILMIAVGCVCYFIVGLFDQINIMLWIIKAIICFIIINVSYYMCYHKTEEFIDVKSKIMRVYESKVKNYEK